jgi:hypothetical protein
LGLAAAAIEFPEGPEVSSICQDSNDSLSLDPVAALSTQLSTAALDKHPQSKERGITLDLGFSSFTCPLPPHLEGLQSDKLQVRMLLNLDSHKYRKEIINIDF